MIKEIKNILRPIKTKLLMTKAKKIRKRNQRLHPDFKCTADTKRCFDNKESPNYRYEYFGENTPACCATHLYDLLRDVSRVLEEHEIEYFISFGTLLGAVRHEGMIPWDTDVDLVVPLKHEERMTRVLRSVFEGKYLVKRVQEACVVGHAVRVDYSEQNSLHVDLFFYKETPEGVLFGYDREITRSELYPLTRLPYYDLELLAPQCYEKHLRALYGKDHMEYAYRQWALDKRKFEIGDYSPAEIEA